MECLGGLGVLGLGLRVEALQLHVTNIKNLHYASPPDVGSEAAFRLASRFCGYTFTYPKGPRTQIIGLRPKYHDVHGIWALKPYYLGPWTLRATLGV